MTRVRVRFLLFLYVYAVKCEWENSEPINNEALESQVILEDVINTQHSYCRNTMPCHEHRRRRDIPSINRIWQGQIELQETSCCGGCSCIPSYCRSEGNCCPDMFNTFKEFVEASFLQETFCVPLQLKPRSSLNDNKTYPNSRESIFMITKCHLNFPEKRSVSSRQKRDSLLQKCENEDVNDVSTIIPVTHKQLKKTYRNIYCAKCVGYEEENLEKWDLQIACNGFTLQPKNMNEVLPMVLDTPGCNIFFYSQYWLQNLNRCVFPISTCNVTGKWTSYNTVIDAACGAYYAPYMQIYNNIFCYMCNSREDIPNDTQCMDNIEVVDKTTLTFAMVLKYGAVDNVDRTDVLGDDERHALCRGNTFYDPVQQACIEIYCMYPKIYWNGSCIDFASKIGGVAYRVFLKLTPRWTALRKTLNHPLLSGLMGLDLENTFTYSVSIPKEITLQKYYSLPCFIF